MRLQARLHRCFAPLRGMGRAMLRDLALVSLATTLALTGGGLILAAGFVALMRLVGVEWALVLAGLGLLALAGLVLLLRRLPPKPAVQPDPMTQVVFDLCFNLGRELTRRRD